MTGVGEAIASTLVVIGVVLGVVFGVTFIITKISQWWWHR